MKPVKTNGKAATPVPEEPKTQQTIESANAFIMMAKLPGGQLQFHSKGELDELIGLHRLMALDIERRLLAVQAAQQPPQPPIVPGVFIR